MVVNMVRQTMRFDDDIHFKTSSIAKKNNLSFNKFVNLVLEDYLNNSGQNSYFKEVDNRLKQLYDIIKSLNKDQKILLKISKQHFANVGYLSNADVKKDKCLNELLRNRDYFNE